MTDRPGPLVRRLNRCIFNNKNRHMAVLVYFYYSYIIRARNFTWLSPTFVIE